MLGTSCCFHIPDYSDNVTNIITHMRMAVKEPKRVNDVWGEWLTNLWGGWGYWLFNTVTNCRGRIIATVMFTMHFPVHIQLSTETGENYGITSIV